MLYMEKPLRLMARRKTDDAYIVDTQKHNAQILANQGLTVMLHREDGFEKQHRSNCTNCGLLVAYSDKVDSNIVFILQGAIAR